MTQDDTSRNTGLDAAFGAARAAPPKPSDAFLARIEADALTVQAEIAAPQAAPRRAVTSGGGWLSMALWRPMSGLAACLVLGIGLGGGLAPQLGALGDYVLAGGTLSGSEVLPASFDEILSPEEG